MTPPIRVEIECAHCNASGLSPFDGAAHCEACQGDGLWIGDVAKGSLTEAMMQLAEAVVKWWKMHGDKPLWDSTTQPEFQSGVRDALHIVREMSP